ncbi:MAG: efflux RND transporter permease subunit [Bacteroidota bacterium]
MMKKLVATFIKYPFYANLIIAVLILGGGIGVLSMKKSFFPERSTTEIIVSVAYPGASPREMEEGVSMRVEEAIRGIVGIKWVNSTSSENFAIVRITSTGDYDIDEMLMEIKNAVDGITSFPVDAEKPIVYKQRFRSNALFMSLVGDDLDLYTLKNYADDIELDLYNSGVMSQIQVSGYPALEISVEASEEALLRHNLTFTDLSRAIALNNRDISAGMIRSDEEEILIRSRAKTYDPDEIGEIILRADAEGRYLRIRDVAQVKMKFAEVPSGAYMNGRKSISFQVFKLSNEDLAEISEFLDDYIEEFNSKNRGVQLKITYSFLDMLGDRLELLYRNGGIGLLLVMISLGLFLNLRLSLWVAWGIPASFLAMFIIAALYGITINMISLFGMILVVGILVDDGIVIAENIYTHYERGKSPQRAALDGTMEVLPAVTTSVTTTIIAFTPLFFLQGRMEMMFEMAFVVIFSLLFSLVEAFFVLPAHVGSNFVLRRSSKKSRWMKVRRVLDKVMNFMKCSLYAPTLRFAIKWKYVSLITPIALILITVGLFRGGQIQSTFFPAIPFDFFNINLAFTPGSGERQTYDYLVKFEDAMWELNEEIKEAYNYPDGVLNYTFISMGNAFNGQETGAHSGNIFVLLRNLEDAPLSSFEIVEKLREKIGPVPEAEKFTVEGRATFGIPVSISLLGKDLDELQLAKGFMMKEMGNIKILKDINDNNAIGKREVQLELKPKAYFLGLNHNDITAQVRQGFFGGQAQRLQIGKDEVRVWVRYPKEDRLNLGQMEAMKIKTPMGEYPLSELASYDIRRGPVNIQRYNMSREVRINANLVDPYAPVPPILEEIRTNIVPSMQEMYPGIRVEYQGQQRDSDEAMADLGKYFGIAFMIIVLLIMVHFKSFTQGSIILMMIPLGWLGAVWGHGIEGYPVSMLTAWGMVALSGVIINDAVVFLSKYNTLIKEGRSVADAAFEAGITRFRPIILTTITTTVGLYPIIMEGSFQAQFLIPMAIALAYGVAIGTAFILLLLPVLILVLSDIRYFMHKLWTGKEKTREVLEPANIFSRRTID